MKTTKTLTAALIIAALICGFTACKKNTPEPPLTATSLENTAWNLVKEEYYEKEGDKWKLTQTKQYSDIIPNELFQLKDNFQYFLYSKQNYSLDPIKRQLSLWERTCFIITLSANELVAELVVDVSGKYRFFFKKIPPLSLAQLKGKWEITALQKNNFDNDEWEDGSFEDGYWIEFGEDGKGKNSRNQTCNYSLYGNIVTIECIYGNAFVVECTADKLVFVHQYKAPFGRYYKETFKRLHKSTIN